jgi:hypothetical protein
MAVDDTRRVAKAKAAKEMGTVVKAKAAKVARAAQAKATGEARRGSKGR